MGGDPWRNKAQESLAETHREYLHIQEAKIGVTGPPLKLDVRGSSLLELSLCMSDSW
jgi:hypothetical protein